MPTFNHEIDIDAPADYTFTWGIEPENWMRATPALIDVETVEETADGTRYRNTMKLLGRTVTSEELYTIDADAMRTTSVFEDELEGEMHWEFTETATGTHVRMHGEFADASSLFERALQPVMSRYMNRQFRNTMGTMKDLVEAEYAADELDAPAA